MFVNDLSYELSFLFFKIISCTSKKSSDVALTYFSHRRFRCWEYRDELLRNDDSYCCLFEIELRFVDLDESGDEMFINFSSSSIYFKQRENLAAKGPGDLFRIEKLNTPYCRASRMVYIKSYRGN